MVPHVESNADVVALIVASFPGWKRKGDGERGHWAGNKN
jgi:hypothetical protein